MPDSHLVIWMDNFLLLLHQFFFYVIVLNDAIVWRNIVT